MHIIQNNYYVYSLINPLTKLPFYIGIGKEVKYRPIGKRPQDHILEAIKFKKDGIKNKKNLLKINIINKLLDENNHPIIRIIKCNISKKDAVKYERSLIKLYGRKNEGGILSNLTDGGEGVENPSQIVRNNLSKRMIGNTPWNKGKKLVYSQERIEYTKFCIQESRKRKKWKKRKFKALSEEHKKKISESLKGRTSTKKGIPSNFIPWNKGLTKDTNNKLKEISIKNSKSIPWNKGKTSPNKGKTYEEIYGYERAQALKEMRRQQTILRHKNKTHNRNGF